MRPAISFPFAFCRRFTFVELLVVAFVLVVMALMVLPIVNRAIDVNHRVACCQNFKQIGWPS